MKTESILLAVLPVATFYQQLHLTNATSFLFKRNGKLFLVTNRHVLYDEPTKHFPDQIKIEVHSDADNLAASFTVSIPLYLEKKGLWRQGKDASGEIDVAVIEIDQNVFPPKALYRAFTPAHLIPTDANIEVGQSLLIPGFPLGFHDTLHHIAVARKASLASSFGYRFQGQGYFLTDARTHRGSSGSPVVMRIQDPNTEEQELPWFLLGIHSATMDMKTRDLKLDEALGLNLCWYADILMTLTEPNS